MTPKRVAVLISGRGSNMTALLDAAADPDFPAEIVLVISNRPEAQGLAVASSRGVRAIAIDHTAFGSKPEFEAAIDAAFRAERVDLVCLAGFMRLLAAGFVDRWRDRILNIHPSLLPAFPGLDTHARALEAGVARHGATVHFVRAETDSGPIIAQAALDVRDEDTPQSLAERVLALEHRLYPAALRMVAAGDVRIDGKTIVRAPGARAWMPESA